MQTTRPIATKTTIRMQQPGVGIAGLAIFRTLMQNSTQQVATLPGKPSELVFPSELIVEPPSGLAEGNEGQSQQTPSAGHSYDQITATGRATQISGNVGMGSPVGNKYTRIKADADSFQINGNLDADALKLLRGQLERPVQ